MAKKYAEEWLADVTADLCAEKYVKLGLSVNDHLADAFLADIPFDKHEAVIRQLQEINPKQLVEFGEAGRAFYMNIFVSEDWYAENDREMEWMEFLNSEFCPEDYPRNN